MADPNEDHYTGGDLFVDALTQYGVERIFGNPGTTELPILDSLSRSELGYEFAAHEDVAVGMAAGYATNRRYHAHHADVNPLGVANVHITPGLAHALGNVYGANMAGAPILVTAGNHSRAIQHEEPILSGDLVSMIDQFTKWSGEVKTIGSLGTMVRRAVRVALTPPTGPVFLELPADIVSAPTDERPEPLGPIPTLGSGDRSQMDRAVDLLADSDDPVMVVGDGIARAGRIAVDSAVELAETIGARVYGEILVSEVNFPTGHDQWVSFIPPDNDTAREIMDTDVLLLVGCSTNTTYSSRDQPLIGPDTMCIHITDDAWEIGKNEPSSCAIIGDPSAVLDDLVSELQGVVPEAVLDERQARIETITDAAAAEEPQSATDPITKDQLIDAIAAVDPHAFVVDESSTTKYVLFEHWNFEPEGFVTNKGGGLGYGMPAAVGAALAEDARETDRTVVGLIGDGAYLYYPQAMYSAVRSGADVTIVIPNNRNYRILKQNMVSMLGGSIEDYDFVGMDIDPPVDFAGNVESYGADAYTVRDRTDLESTLETAFGVKGPTLVDVAVRD